MNWAATDEASSARLKKRSNGDWTSRSIVLLLMRSAALDTTTGGGGDRGRIWLG
jgi:hypothetical protein